MPEPRIGSLHTDLPKEEEERLRSALARLLKGSPDAGGAPMEVEGEIRRREKGVVCRLSSRYEDLPVARKARGATPEEAVQEAAAALKEVLLRHAPYLERYTGRTPVMEFHVLARPCGRAAGEPPERHYVRKLSAEEAMVELDLSGEPGMIFYDTATGKPTVLLNLGEGRFRLLEPSPDTAGRAGVETSLDSLRTEARKEPPPGEDEGVRPHAGEGPSAEKYRRIRPRLRCPACKGELHDTEGGLACMECTRRFEIRGGVPVLHIDPDHDPEPRETPVSKNPYGQQTLKMFEKHAEGLVLDCGAGCPPETFGNVIHLEIVRYPGVDVVADGLHLPFADETFDAVVSEAVLEHVKDPFGYTAELRRVLKPGGEIRVDAAFLQPFHAYPHHYFNMTLSGLELLMEGFVKIDAGCGPHQQPLVTLGLVLQGVLDGIPDPEQRKRALEMRAGEILHILNEEGDKEPFQTLSSEAVTRLAAGFYFYGYKPPPEPGRE